MKLTKMLPFDSLNQQKLLVILKRLPLFILLLTAVLLILVYAGAFGPVPSKTVLKELQHNAASEVYSSDGVLLGRYARQDRTIISYDDISPYAVQALIATEDARFYEHSGIDYRSLGRVFVKSLLLDDESAGGGSTLSQQIAKNVYPRSRLWLLSTPINKIREMIIASRLEEVYNKQEIIELYFNTVPMGENIYGLERAAERFFSTSADKLTLEQAAVLVGMLKANTTYSPRRYPERSEKRRNVVLNQMQKYGYLKESEAEKAKKRPLRLKYHIKPTEIGLAPYFREQLRVEMEAWCEKQRKPNGTPYNLYRDGLKIVTTLDSRMQAQAEKAVKSRMSGLQQVFNRHWKGRSPWDKEKGGLDELMRRSQKYKKLKESGKSEEEIRKIFQTPKSMKVYSWNGPVKRTMSPLDSLQYYELFLNTGLVSIEPGSGHVKAWVGGINHRIFKYDHVRAKRQAGSTFKPFVYAAALEDGTTPCTPFANEKVSYPEYENWTPRNANGAYGGTYTMGQALAQSVNTISAQVLLQTGIEETIDLAHRLGIKSELPEVPSLALGTANLSLLELVTAYTTFANSGSYIEPVFVISISDNKGNVLLQNPAEAEGEQVLEPEYAITMLQLMQGVVEGGSARRLRDEFGLRMDIAGKTGTTQNHSDGWFIGITPDLVTGVWVGAQSPLVRFRTLKLGQGSNTALPVWGEYMLRLSRAKPFRSYRKSRFTALPQELIASLDCEGNKGLEEEGFFRKLLSFFSFSEPEKDKETQGKPKKKQNEKEWERAKKRSEKQREQEKKRLEEQLKQQEKEAEKLKEEAEKLEEQEEVPEEELPLDEESEKPEDWEQELEVEGN